MRKSCLLFNTRAGSAGDVRRVLERYATRLPHDVLAAASPERTRELARQAVERGYGRLIVAGGDGTLSQVINGLVDRWSDIELAILPLGTGNDLARSLGIPIDDTAAAIALAAGGPAREVDVGHVRGAADGYFVNAASGGAGGRVAHEVHAHDKERWGPLAYWMTAFGQLTRLQEFEVVLDVDGHQYAERVYGLIVANGRYVGGGYPIAPRAWLDDGLLDVTAIPVLPTLELLSAGLNYMLGRYEQVEQIRFFRGRRIRITSEPAIPVSIDGEPLQELDTVFEVVPRALRIVAGPNPPALAPWQP